MHWPDQHPRHDQTPYLDKLNDAQKEAVLNTEGPVMIIAGAGSGKTRVLTVRMAHLIHSGADPFSILALTFTNKAAREMRNRIENLVGPAAKSLWMGTFHSVFARILRLEADRLGYPKNFTIYDTDDSKSLIKSITKELGLDDKVYKPSLVLGRISMCKNNLIDSRSYSENEENLLQDKNANRNKFYQIFQVYTERCFRAGAMDFDDILVNTYKLLRDHIDICNKWQHKFRFIMVDEYQDTNHVQYMITKRLAAVHQNIAVVGDDAQSIYAFRGANIQNILNFSKDYPDVKVFKLEQNYRSTKNIVSAAGSLIKHNKKQLDKEVWTQNDTGEKIRVVRSITEAEEARFVAQSIFEEKNTAHYPNKAFAVLYRTNSQSRAFEEAMRKNGIDYRIYGGTSFYQRKEIKDLLAYLRLVINPGDEEALKRIINYPARQIGDTTVNKLVFLATQSSRTIWEIVANARRFPELGTAAVRVENFAMMVQGFMGMAKTHNAYDLAMHIARQTTLLKTLYDDKTVEGVSRYENTVELLNGIKEFTEDDESEVEKSLANFLEEVALYTDDPKNNDPNRDCVSLMTIHQAKGLEFPHVYVVGLEENLFPSQMALTSRQDLEEERRLFYVAITRAEKKLNLTFATSRFRYGNLMPCEPSRFIEEIDNEFLDMNLAGLKNEGMFQRFNGPSNGDKDRGKPKTGSVLKQIQKTTSASLPPVDPNFQEGDLGALKVGDKVQHQRFGFGMVKEMEGDGSNKKATVTFEALGEKKLVLKFAKMRIV
ncbi:MAG: UvrD-helicase domain-containing protein [Bacteroidetes bacterium]|nr:UvrD-helicase domain-containing protein [Bacteroidota bacterium]